MTLKILVAISGIFLTMCSFGQSQMEMNLEAKKAYERADNELNEVYQAILKKYSSDKDFIANLKKSERLWIEFRDAELLVKYPQNDGSRNGSVFPLCYYNYLTELTQKRTETLRHWLEGEEEGEVCSGTIRIR
jgi:uncharacterized protein YecT (DUF1311 family)